MQTSIPKNPFYAKLAYVLVSLIALIYLAVVGKELIAPLIFSFLFAILLFPFASFLEQKLKLPRGIACLFTVILFLVIIVGLLYLLGAQFAELSSDWPVF